MTTRRTALTAAALVTPALLAALLMAPSAASADPTVHFSLVGRHVSGPADGGAEVSAVLGDRLYSIDDTGLEIVDVSDPSTPTLETTIPHGAYGASITSSASAATAAVTRTTSRRATVALMTTRRARTSLLQSGYASSARAPRWRRTSSPST